MGLQNNYRPTYNKISQAPALLTFCWLQCTDIHQFIEADTISLWDTEGRLQRSFLWDKGMFDGGWWALDKHEWEAVLGKKERWSMVPSQQWDTKPREWLKQTQGTGECVETGSGKIVCQCWSPWQRLMIDSEFSIWLTPYIQTWKEME